MIKIDTGLFKETFRIFVICKIYVWAIIFMMMTGSVIETFAPKSSEALDFGVFVAWVLFLLQIFRKLLMADSDIYRFNREKAYGFTLRSFALCLLGIIPGMVLAYITLAAFSVSSKDIGAYSLISFLAIWISATLALSIFGTWLPAYIEGRAPRLMDAYDRFPSQFGYTFRRLNLIILPLFGVEIIVLVAPIYFDIVPEFFSETGVLNPLGILSNLISLTIAAFWMTMIAVILSRAYFLSNTDEN